MSHSPLTVLVTGAGAPGIRGTIYALRTNPEKRPIRIIGVDTDEDVVGRFLVDAFYQIPGPENPTYIENLASICHKECASFILPQTTREVMMLCRHKLEFVRRGLRIMVSDQQAIECANNKWRLLAKFEELRLPCPVFRLAKSEEELIQYVGELGYPKQRVVIKPLVSNGMRGFRVLCEDAWDVPRFLADKPAGLEASLDDILKILRRGPGWPELLVTEFLPGPEYTVDVFRGEKMAVALPRLRKRIRSGITFHSQSDDRADIVDFSLRAARHIGLNYAFGFQFKLDANAVPKILECNPRIQGTMVASVFSGVNVIWLALKELLGEPVQQIDAKLTPAGFYRFWGGMGVHAGHVDEI